MKALVYNFRKNKFLTREIPTPRPRQNEVLVRVYVSALCGTDLHVLNGVMRKKKYNPGEIILGHAWTGVIKRTGADVRGFLKGDRVYGADYVPCGHCKACAEGRENDCDERTIPGIELRGSHAEYMTMEARLVHKLPSNIDMLAGSYVADCVAVADRAVRRVNVKKGDAVVIYGAGPIGLAMGLLLRIIYRVKNISVVEPETYRRHLAAKLFNPVFFSGKQGKEFKNRFDVAYEASGALGALSSAFHNVRRGGDIVVVGVHDEVFPLETFKLVSRDIRLSGTFTYPLSELRRAMQLARKIKAGRLITHIFPLADGALAYKQFKSKKTGIVILMPPNL